MANSSAINSKLKKADLVALNKIDKKFSTQTLSTIRNIKPTPYKNVNQHQTNDEIFNASYTERGIQPTYKQAVVDTKITKQPKNDADYSNINQRQNFTTPQNIISDTIIKTKLKVKNKTVNKLAKAEARGVNLFIRSTGLFFWSVFQVPMAMLNIVFLGLTNITLQSNIDPNGNVVANAVRSIGNTVIGAIETVASGVISGLEFITGIDLSLIDITALFMITMLVIFAFGLFNLLGIYLIYKILGLNPLSGRGGGVKIGATIMATIGYFVPFLNLFPWFYLWTIAVQKYPK